MDINERKYNAALGRIASLEDNLMNLQAQAQVEIEMRDARIAELASELATLKGEATEAEGE